jgi:diacylglycerol kinase family enzyme
MRALIIINPIAGVRLPGDTPDRRVALARRLLARHGIDGAVRVTERAGHARELAAQAAAEECELVVAWGGDGTVNEIAGVLIRSPTALGIVPAGSGNGLAHGLGLPVRPIAALERALVGSERKIDVGEFGGRRFFNVAGIGFDAAVAARFNRQGHARGPLACVGPSPPFPVLRGGPCVIGTDGESLSIVLMVTSPTAASSAATR